MALLSRLYFNAVFGALGGLLGWMLFGIFGDKSAASDQVARQLLMGGALIGGAIGYFGLNVESIRDHSLLRFVRLAAYGVVLGLIGGALGILVGDWVNYYWIGASRDRPFLHLLGAMFTRGLGWMFLGMTVGFSEGIAARSLGKFSYGTLGAAHAIADSIPEDHLTEDYIVPSVFEKRVVRAVAKAAHDSGVARRREREVQ